MASKSCKLCNLNIGKKLKLQCGRCKGYFHLKCGDVTEVDARIMQDERRPWTCVACKGTTNGNGNGDRRSILFSQNTRTDEDPELKALIRELREEVRELRRSVEFLSEKYEEEKNRSKVLSDMVNEISKDNSLLKQEVKALQDALNVQEQRKLGCNICITGLVKESDEEDAACGRLATLFRSLNVAVPEFELKSIRRIKVKNAGVKLIIALPSEEFKNRVLDARSKRGRITMASIGLGEMASPIYLDEELTKQTYELYRKARQLRQKGYKYVWHKNGDILVRRSDNDHVVSIKSHVFLDSLLE